MSSEEMTLIRKIVIRDPGKPLDISNVLLPINRKLLRDYEAQGRKYELRLINSGSYIAGIYA